MERDGMPKLAVGLDIGSSQIKVCVLKQRGKKYRLVNFGLLPLPPETIVDGEILNSAALVSSIRELLASQNIRVRDACLGLGGASVILRQISLPRMSEEELEESLAWEAKQYIPFDLEEVYLDFHISPHAPDADQMDVILVAAKRHVVDDYCAAARLAGLNPVVVDIHAFALVNSLEISRPDLANTCVCLIDVGANQTAFVVTRGGEVMQSRSREAGSNSITENLQRNLAIPFAQAEAFKSGGAGMGVVPADVQQLLEQGFNELADEVRQMLDYHIDQGGDPPEIGLVSGGGARSQTLIQALSQKLGFPCEATNPFGEMVLANKAINVPLLEAVAPQAAISAGMATRASLDRLSTSKEREKKSKQLAAAAEQEDTETTEITDTEPTEVGFDATEADGEHVEP